MELLFIIPARGGSKGIPGKNIKPLNGKPLIHYSIEFARRFAPDEHICLTTDSDDIIAAGAAIGLRVPFKRPESLAADSSGTYEVLQHALRFYVSSGKSFDAVVLLQPTSPFRKERHLTEALQEFNDRTEMVVSVQESKANPYYNLFEEDDRGFLRISKGDGGYTRRQDVPGVYAYNGALYIIDPEPLLKKSSFREFSAVRKYVMEEKYSVDLDTAGDWRYAEFLLQQDML